MTGGDAARRRASSRTASSSAPRSSTASTRAMRLAQEEIFGPVLAVMPFRDERGGARDRERHPLRADGERLHERPAHGARVRARRRGRLRLGQRQRAPLPRHAVRRLQGERPRPRGGHRGAVLLHPGQERQRALRMRVFLLDGGTMMIDRSQLLWNVDCGVRLRFPVYSVLVEHERRALPLRHGLRPRARPPRRSPPSSRCRARPRGSCSSSRCAASRPATSLRRQLAPAFRPRGRQPPLPAAPRRVVSKAELRQAKVPETFERYAYSDQTFDHPGVDYELLEGDVELARGLRLFETPGHSAGHYSLLIEPPSGEAAALRVRRGLRAREPRPADPVGLPSRPDGRRPLAAAAQAARPHPTTRASSWPTTWRVRRLSPRSGAVPRHSDKTRHLAPANSGRHMR